jgi:hypothetical protein
MRGRPLFGVALGITIFALAGCAGQSVTPSGNQGQALAQTVSPLSVTQSLAPNATFNVSGTYDGSMHWSDNGKSYSASLKVTLSQSGSKLTGSFEASGEGKSLSGSLDGTVKIEGKKKAALAFTIYLPKDHTADATATVKGKKLSGKASAGSTTVSFSAKKAKK